MPDPSLLELLRESEAQLPRQRRAEVLALITPVLERLQEPWPADAADEVVEVVFGLCRKLWAGARSGEALSLAQALLESPAVMESSARSWRVSTMCGVLAGDSGDVAGAMGHYMRALRIAMAERTPDEVCVVWNNIGMALSNSGHYEMGARCYERSLSLLESIEEPTYSRYTACANLANCHYQLGNFPAGTRYAERALLEMTPELRDRDVYAAMTLRRNVARLLVASGRAADAEIHVKETIELARHVQSPRALIAAATTQAIYEIAIGRADVALTRLDQALAKAREVPAVLRDTLACLIQAEEAAGDPARALMRLEELSRHIYVQAVERVRDYVEIATIADGISRADGQRAQTKARLIARLPPPAEPPGWKALQRLGVSAAMRIDPTGWHGRRVGALTKALALEWGIGPLQALEMGLAAELHDIGMMSVPSAILAKQGPLNEAEEAIVRRHTEAGDEMLRDEGHPRMILAREIAKYHHAHWDGNGYPERVGGRFIPLGARMCAVADAYDMMVFGYGGRAPRSMSEALEELGRQAGRQFDPELVSCFDALIRREVEERGLDLTSGSGMEDFQELVLSLKENRGFV